MVFSFEFVDEFTRLSVSVREFRIARKWFGVGFVELVDFDMGFGRLDVVGSHGVMQITARIRGRAANKAAALGGKFGSCLWKRLAPIGTGRFLMCRG